MGTKPALVKSGRPPESCGGFTLLEILVVMVLVGLITGVLFQALGQVLRVQRGVGEEIYLRQQGAMLMGWFRQSVNALMPEYEDGKHRFRGSAREFSGLTLAPLDAPQGNLVPFGWRLRFDPASGQSHLEYVSGERPAIVLSWRGNSGAFAYLDDTGKRHEQWPPFLGQWPQLPAAIEFSGPTDAPVTVAARRGPVAPWFRLKDIENF